MLLLPVPPGSGEDATEAALRSSHASLAQAALDQDFFPPLPAAVHLRSAAARRPDVLACAERLAPHADGRPGLLSLLRLRGSGADEAEAVETSMSEMSL